MFRARVVFIILITLGSQVKLWAHAPIFIPAAESHGAHAFDLHLGVHRMGPDAYEIEQMWGFGLARNFTFHVGAGTPFVDGKIKKIEEVMLGGSWIFWSRNKFQAKQALALQVSSHFHADQEDGTGYTSLGRTFPAALAYSIERRYWNFFASARALPRAGGHANDGHSSNGQMQGHRIDSFHTGSAPAESASSTTNEDNESKYTGWGDVGYAYRFLDIARREIDLMLFLGTSARFGSQYAQYLSPEVWIGPNGRMLFKVGYQFPVIQHDENASKGGQWAYELEIRF